MTYTDLYDRETIAAFQALAEDHRTASPAARFRTTAAATCAGSASLSCALGRRAPSVEQQTNES